MRSGEPWMADETEYLVRAYREKQREKEIAIALNRSHIAVSRKIDSLKLRELCGKERKGIYKEGVARNKESSACNKNGENKMIVSSLPWAPEIVGTSMEPGVKDVMGLNWVEFRDVLKWLESIDIPVRRSFFKNASYICEGKYLTEAQVLLICNQYRLRYGLLVMHVCGITKVE